MRRIEDTRDLREIFALRAYGPTEPEPVKHPLIDCAHWPDYRKHLSPEILYLPDK